MTLKILASKTSMESAMKLRDALEEILGLSEKTIRVSKDSGSCIGHTVLLRYGAGYGNLQKEPEWSSKVFFQTCINKLSFSNAFRENFLVPIFENEELPTKYPVLIRETLEGTQSHGINVVHNSKEFLKHWTPGFYWTEFFKAQFELRVYVAVSNEDYSVRIYKKVPRDQGDSDDEFIAGENGEDNTSWSLRNPADYPKVTNIVRGMLPKLYEMGGRFVGLDMIYVPEKKNYVTLEMNSGPWLSPKTANWLADFFLRTQGRKFFDADLLAEKLG